MSNKPEYKWRSAGERRRYLAFAALIFGVIAVLFVRYAYLMLRPERNTGAVSRARAVLERGPIRDRNGRILAIQTKLGNVSVWKPDVKNLDELSSVLAPLINMNAEEITARINESASDFVYLKKNVEQQAVTAIEAEQANGSLGGVGIEPVIGRVYPEGQLAGSLLGFTGDDNAGLAGIEYAFNNELLPAGGAGGGAGANLQHGNQIFLTLDANVQYILEGIANKVLTENEAEAVMLFALEPKSGDILGAASVPGFDPNNWRLSADNIRADRPSIWAYEPGSVFKVYSLAAMLDAGSIMGGSVFVCDGRYEHTTSSGETVVIGCLSAHGRVTPAEIIIYSCNAGAAYASDKIAAAPFYNYLKDFGFGAKTGAGLSGETAGFLRAPERWSARSKPTIAMGQEIAVSALQMLQAATAIANDGVLVQPRLVSRFVSADGKTETSFETEPPRRVLKPETARALRSYMTQVTSSIGTGWRASVEDLSLAVKTGTAQVIDPVTRAYSETNFIATCLALLPADDPRLVLYIVIVHPKGESYLGGRIAAPPIREAAEALVNHLGIPRGRNPQVSHTGNVRLPSERLPDIEGYIPDFRGYSKRQLLPLLLIDEFSVEIEGEGWVARQNPPAGTLIKRGMKLTLYLE